MDFKGRSVEIGIIEGGDERFLKGGRRREPADCVNEFGLWDSVDFGGFWKVCYCHSLGFLCFN